MIELKHPEEKHLIKQSTLRQPGRHCEVRDPCMDDSIGNLRSSEKRNVRGSLRAADHLPRFDEDHRDYLW